MFKMGLNQRLFCVGWIGLLCTVVQVQLQCFTNDASTSLVTIGACAPASQSACIGPSLAGTDLNSFCAGSLCCYTPSTGTGTGGSGGGNAANLQCGISQANVNSSPGGVTGPFLDNLIREASENFIVGPRMARILGGTNVLSTVLRPCWIASILINNVHTAVGAIVNANYVMTTASSIQRVNRANPQNVKVRLGSLSATSTASGTEISVSSVTPYTSWRNNTPGYPTGDIALLRLSTPIDFFTNMGLCGACLPNAMTSTSTTSTVEPFLGERCHVAGYGASSTTTTFSDNLLREVLVPVIPTAVCDRIYTTSLRRQYTTDPTSFCAGGQQGKDTCSKDGGAPLACISAERLFYVVAGLSSWGVGCGIAGTPSVYTNLANLGISSWIRLTSGGGAFPQPTPLANCPVPP